MGCATSDTLRPHEWVSADALDWYFRSRLGIDVGICPGEKQQAPDVWLTAMGRRFAVEETSVVVGEAHHVQTTELHTAIRLAALADDVLNGGYLLRMRGSPVIPRRTSQGWSCVVASAVAYIGATQGPGAPPPWQLLEDASGTLEILKRSDRGAEVGLMVTARARSADEVRLELRHRICEAILTKRRKLEKAGVPATCPDAILLLYDAYSWAEEDDVCGAFEGVAGHEWFHSVFWASSFTRRQNQLRPDLPGRQGIFLYSKEPSWLPPASLPSE